MGKLPLSHAEDGHAEDDAEDADAGHTDAGHAEDDADDVAHSCTIFPCYLGMEINQCRDPMNHNKDCRVG